MNTPETDKRVWSDHSEGILYQVVEASFARKLERERDEAREERDIAKLEFEEISNDLSDAINRIRQLENQIKWLNNFANERYEEIQKVHKERDEAREEINRYREKLDLLPISRNEKPANGIVDYFENDRHNYR